MKILIYAFALLFAGCVAGGGGGGTDPDDPDTAPECIAPAVVCEDGWQVYRGWAIYDEDGTPIEFAGHTFDDDAPPTEGAEVSSIQCAPPGVDNVDNGSTWPAEGVEAFGYYATIDLHPDGSVRTVREHDETGSTGFDCFAGAELAHRVIDHPAGGEPMITEFPENSPDGGQ